MNGLTPQDIYAQTNGGLDIIIAYYPDAEPASRKRSKLFKIREEATASASVTEHNGVWWVKDFGSGEKAYSPIDVVMKEERIDFAEAMKLIPTKFGLVMPDSGKQAKAGYDFLKRDALPDEEEGRYYPTLRKEWLVSDLKAIFSRQIWSYLSRKNLGKDDPGTEENAVENAVAICKQYHLHALEKYTLIKDRKALEFIATPTYPILMFDEGQWQKFYKPKEREKSRRFFSTGQKPTRYLFGMVQCQNKLGELQAPKPGLTDDNGDSVPGTGTSANRDVRLNEIIICTGGSDALNVAALGYPVIWQNSETAELSDEQYKRISKMCQRLYNLPDIDDTGKREAHKLAMTYLDLHTIYLPDSLRLRRDLRGNFCKDVRDFFTYHGKKDFANCVKMAYPLQFWDEEARMKDDEPVMKYGRKLMEYKPNNELIYNFLYRNGFGIMKLPNDKRGEILVHVAGNVVREIEFSDINTFVKEFLKERFAPIDLLNAFHRSNQFSEASMANLMPITVNFDAFGRHHQYLFFQNEAWRITPDAIESHAPGKSEVYVWEKEVLLHDVKVKDAPFTVSLTPQNDWDIQIHDKSCLFLRYMINASRVHWRKELEDELDGLTKADQEAYLKEHRWSIDGPLLNAEEIKEQKQHLVNKLCSFGYLLHRYKNPAAAYAIWAMDAMMANTEDSNGGTGKSMAYGALTKLLPTKRLGGRDARLTDNPHVLEGTTEHTDLILLDDANRYLDFQFFFSTINAFTIVNPKGMAAYELPFEKSPKMVITSNFPPKDTDKATMRRLWFTAFSDYYHVNPNGEYREERVPIGEFGKSLFTDFDAGEWNAFMNVMARSVQAWMVWGKVEPPMENVMLNTYKAQMGPTFHAWADSYFRVDEQRLNRLVPRYMAQETYKPLEPNVGSQVFMMKLQAWCRFNNYTLNPVELLTGKDRRIMRSHSIYQNNRGEWSTTGKKDTREYVFIQTSADIKPVVHFWDEDETPPTPLPF